MTKKNDIGEKEWFVETKKKGCTYKRTNNYDIVKAIKKFFNIK